MDMYRKMGVRKIINATGTVTRLGGSRMPRRVYRAMAAAGRSFVVLDELQQKAGDYIAQLLGVDAAYISSGAAGGMVLAAAACIAGTDADRILKLPDTGGWKNEIIVQNIGSHYVYQGMRHTGARLIEAGSKNSFSLSDIEDAVTANTVAVQLFLGLHGQPGVSEVAPIARRYGVKLIVDAAAELPPRKNIKEPIDQGADLVVFSGGKGIRGPQATGIIIGDRRLIEACRVNSNPHNSIGRPMKVGKEDICGLVAALEKFISQDEEEELSEYEGRARAIVRRLGKIQGIHTAVLTSDPRARPVVPRVYIDIESDLPLTGDEVSQRLLTGNPPIAVGKTDSGLKVDVMMLGKKELRLTVRRLRQVLTSV